MTTPLRNSNLDRRKEGEVYREDLPYRLRNKEEEEEEAVVPS
jgi:hypothetical protein